MSSFITEKTGVGTGGGYSSVDRSSSPAGEKTGLVGGGGGGSRSTSGLGVGGGGSGGVSHRYDEALLSEANSGNGSGHDDDWGWLKEHKKPSWEQPDLQSPDREVAPVEKK